MLEVLSRKSEKSGDPLCCKPMGGALVWYCDDWQLDIDNLPNEQGVSRSRHQMPKLSVFWSGHGRRRCRINLKSRWQRNTQQR
jgi:hypothetical protein